MSMYRSLVLAVALASLESEMDPEGLARTLTIARADGSRSGHVHAINHTSDVGPVWSPAGVEIAFQAQRIEGSRSWINLVRPDGTSKRQLVPDATRRGRPTAADSRSSRSPTGS